MQEQKGKQGLLKNGGGGSEAWSKREAVWNINEKREEGKSTATISENQQEEEEGSQFNRFVKLGLSFHVTFCFCLIFSSTQIEVEDQISILFIVLTKAFLFL